MGTHRAEQGLALLRILTGLLILQQAFSHLAWAPVPVASFTWVDFLQTRLISVAALHPMAFVREAVQNSFLPGVITLAHVLAIAELCVGISILLGFFTVLGCLGGLGLVVFAGVVFYPLGGAIVPLQLLLGALMLVFLVVRAGRRWGFDAVLARVSPHGRLW